MSKDMTLQTRRRRTTRGRRYPSLTAFYRSPERLGSPERDVGLRWVAADGSTYRAAWVEATGELYAVEHVRPDGCGGAVEVLGRVAAGRLESVLDGWRTVCGAPRSYEWLRSRVRESPQRRAWRPATPAIAV